MHFRPDSASLRDLLAHATRYWRQLPAGRRLVVMGVVILAIILGVVLGARYNRKPVSAPAVPVTAALAYQGTLVTYLSQPGTVKPANSVVVRSRVDGELTRVAFTGGEQVKAGDLLAEIDPGPYRVQLKQTEGDLARSQAQLDNAQDTLKRYQALLQQDSITTQRVADQRSLVREYAAAAKTNQARVDTGRLQLSYTRITAPISGMVGLRRVDSGNLVGPSDANGITVITQSQPSTITFAIPVASAGRVLAWLHKGDCIPVDAYVDGLGSPLGTGRLRAANNQVDPATGTVKLEAEFANTEGTLLPNQFVTVKLPDQVLPNAVLVPTDAIQHGAAGPFVYVVKADKTAAVVQVKVGPGDAVSTAIEAGLAPGTKVVVEGADRLRAGTAMNVTTQAGHSQTSAGGLPECRPVPASAIRRGAAQDMHPRPQPDAAARP
ncbi:efflux RND transporter periplasmic adaptor subunit [Burkholderia sp. 22PA0106]|uniref:efflux RND transporter periplasmic adaptor subunit n=1 Tax=Burkholderia sp. 22PA0106 TaxID=3237371 RepID=UPI0039C3F6F5